MRGDHVGDGSVVGVTADLDLIYLELERLRELASATEGDHDQLYSFSIRWGAVLSGRLERLACYAGEGRLTPDERERYRTLCRRLHQALPLMKWLGVASPKVPLEVADR